MEAINFLLDFAFNALLMLLVLRVWLQLVRADFYNPLSQFIVKVTNPLVIPLRRVIPGFGGVDVSTLLLAFTVAVLKFVIIPLLNGGDLNILSALYLFNKTIRHVVIYVIASNSNNELGCAKLQSYSSNITSINRTIFEAYKADSPKFWWFRLVSVDRIFIT